MSTPPESFIEDGGYYDPVDLDPQAPFVFPADLGGIEDLVQKFAHEMAGPEADEAKLDRARYISASYYRRRLESARAITLLVDKVNAKNLNTK